jgi:hypothetical protein
MLNFTGGGGIGRGLFLKPNEEDHGNPHSRCMVAKLKESNEEYPAFEV